jgi:hypothetical protein
VCRRLRTLCQAPQLAVLAFRLLGIAHRFYCCEL